MVGRLSITLAVATVVAFATAGTADADIGLELATRDVHVGGTLRGWSNGSGFPIYIVPSSLAPKRRSCHNGTAICEPTVRRPPGRPFVLLGRVAGRFGHYARHRFAFRIPRIRSGLYRVFIYCRPCGRILIESGNRLEGETVRIRA